MEKLLDSFGLVFVLLILFFNCASRYSWLPHIDRQVPVVMSAAVCCSVIMMCASGLPELAHMRAAAHPRPARKNAAAAAVQ
jgi:hypothetical protein